jgi:hypothetical protein
MMLTAGLLLAAGLIAGLSLPVSSVIAIGLSVGSVYLLGQDSVRFMPYPQQTSLLAGITLAAALILRGALSRASWIPPEKRPMLIAVLAGSLVFKLTGLFYPLLFSSDAEFHVNRLLEVLEGNFFTTSVTQHTPPFRIPYPVSLYVLAAPFAALTQDLTAVLKGLTAFADIAVGLVLAFLCGRFLEDVRAGILAAAIYQLVPVNFLAFSSGNFTNLFGVAATALFLGLLLSAPKGRWALHAVGLFLISLLALTSHLGSFLYGLVLWPAWLAAIAWVAPVAPDGRQTRRIVGATVGSIVVACAYYSGYAELFTSQWERVLSRDYATGDAGTEGPLAKLVFNLAFYRQQLGSLFPLVALLGAIPILRKPSASSFHAAATAWIGVTVLFFLLDLTTALEVRYVLQALPLLAIFAGSFLSGALGRGKTGRLAAVLALGYLAVLGLVSYRYCLLERYH